MLSASACAGSFSWPWASHWLAGAPSLLRRPQGPARRTPVPSTGPGPQLRLSSTRPSPTTAPRAAQKIDRASVVSGEIQAVQPATKPDEDWYIVRPDQSPRDVSAQLSYRGPPPAEPLSGGFVLEAYDRDHNRIETRSGSLTTGSLASLPTLRVRDVLFIRVAGRQAVFPYALKIDLSTPDPNAEAEPNDRAVDATPLALDHPLRGSYGSEADQDYYVIDLAPALLADGGATTATTASPPPARWLPTRALPLRPRQQRANGEPAHRGDRHCGCPALAHVAR